MTAEDLSDLVEKKIPAQPFRKAGERKRSCRGVILDALFGIGLSRNVEGAYRKLIRWINGQEDMKVIAVDVPSGISSDNGSVMGDAVRADVTVTFGEKKLGQVLFPGRELCGHLLVKDGLCAGERRRTGKTCPDAGSGRSFEDPGPHG